MILAGLWFLTHKPTMSTYLRPLIDTMNDLFVNGECVINVSRLMSFLEKIWIQVYVCVCACMCVCACACMCYTVY